MALRFSTGLRNFLQGYGSLQQAMWGGKLLIYSGSQPASADTAVKWNAVVYGYTGKWGIYS